MPISDEKLPPRPILEFKDVDTFYGEDPLNASNGTTGRDQILSRDGNAEFVRALGLEMDASAYGMGLRARRFALYAEEAPQSLADALAARHEAGR